MKPQEANTLKAISEDVIECWTRIKAKARTRGEITNIEKYAPCITKALNEMEQFLNQHTQEQIRLKRLQRENYEEQRRLAHKIPLWGDPPSEFPEE